jgi:nucleoside-diphosphate-sugar epimerase
LSTVLVTGGTGFVGSWMKRQQYKFIPADWEVFYLSHRDYDSMDWLDGGWNYIVHLANIDPTEVITIAEENKARLLYCSSGAVYKQKPNQYALNKKKWELQVKVSKTNYSIARLFTFCGKGLRGNHFAVNSFMEQAALDHKIDISGDGYDLRSYMHGSDLGDWMWTILFKGVPSRVYDVGSNDIVSIGHLAEEITKYFPANIHIKNILDPNREKIYLPKASILTEIELGLDHMNFEDSIKLAIEDFYNER